MLCLALHVLPLRGCCSKIFQLGQGSSDQSVMRSGPGAQGVLMCAGVSLTALAEAAQLGTVGGQAGSPLLSEAAKAAGVPCSPAQLYFLALEQVRAREAILLSPCLDLPLLSANVWLRGCSGASSCICTYQHQAIISNQDKIAGDNGNISHNVCSVAFNPGCCLESI